MNPSVRQGIFGNGLNHNEMNRIFNESLDVVSGPLWAHNKTRCRCARNKIILYSILRILSLLSARSRRGGDEKSHSIYSLFFIAQYTT